jgi:hypothetical protein
MLARVQRRVLGVCEQGKVGGAVIGSVTVPVVYLLGPQERATEDVLHHETVSEFLAVRGGLDLDIAVCTDVAPAALSTQ